MPFLGLRQYLDEDFLRCNKGIDEEGAKYSHICGKVDHHATFVKYVPPPSEAVRGNARVGCGKETMASLLCGAWLERNPDARVGHFVYNKAAKREAQVVLSESKATTTNPKIT